MHENLKNLYRVPGRFEDHECTFITWPCIGDAEIDLFREETIKIANIISEYEKVIIIVDPRDASIVLNKCSDFSDIWVMETDMSWIRDNGPIFIKNNINELAAIHFKFNGWGKKFHPYDKVKKIPSLIAEKLNIKCFKSNLILEGGGVSFDGEGTMVTTEQMLLNKNRNINFTRQEIEEEVYRTLGIEKIIWLKKGLLEDKGTDGHVDCVAEYLAPGKILAQTIDKNNPNYELLKNNFEILKYEKDAKGRRLDIIEMPYLPYYQTKNNKRYVSPYTNYYIINNAIIVPEVDPKIDNLAYKIIEQIFPKRKLIPIPALYQAIGGGGPGCITQQMPISSNIKIS